MSIPWSEFVAFINEHRRFVLTSHVRPDCDALGSELGMAMVLEALGKEVVIVNGQTTPPNLAFIDPTNRIKTIGVEIQPEEILGYDVHMILDTSAWAQLGAMSDVIRNTRAKKAILDHHVSEDDLGAIAFKNTKAEATGRLVYEAAEALGVKLTREMAMPLFAALATDTGWFRFPSTSETTYKIAAGLVAAGAVPAEIYAALYEQDTLGRVRLRGTILARVESECGGRLVHTYVERGDYERTGALPSDTEDVINMALAIAGAQAAFIVVEQPAGGCKISFRSRCALDCNAMAARFNGGGHKAAAGAFLDEPLETARAKILEAMKEELKIEN